jgi:hypothetical protein
VWVSLFAQFAPSWYSPETLGTTVV